eukprot:ANDGO_00566.mRNA.1 Vesicle-associated membrane protein-associated protein C16G5.05c
MSTLSPSSPGSSSTTTDLVVTPSALFFPTPLQRPITNIVSLQNVTCQPHETPLAFKVKTTAPGRYVVKPRAGILLPGQTVHVSITLTIRDATGAILSDLQNQAMRDKFMLEFRVLEDEFVSSKPGADDDVWEKGKYDEARVTRQKVKCLFENAPPEMLRVRVWDDAKSQIAVVAPELMSQEQVYAVLSVAANTGTPTNGGGAKDSGQKDDSGATGSASTSVPNSPGSSGPSFAALSTSPAQSSATSSTASGSASSPPTSTAAQSSTPTYNPSQSSSPGISTYDDKGAGLDEASALRVEVVSLKEEISRIRDRESRISEKNVELKRQGEMQTRELQRMREEFVALQQALVAAKKDASAASSGTATSNAPGASGAAATKTVVVADQSFMQNWTMLLIAVLVALIVGRLSA